MSHVKKFCCLSRAVLSLGKKYSGKFSSFCWQTEVIPISVMQCGPLLQNGISRSSKFTVAVEGNIGSGKTTLLKYFSKFPDTLSMCAALSGSSGNIEIVLQEPVDRWRNVRGHNLLHLMYNDPMRWSLTFQTYVQLTMLDLHKREQKLTERVKLMERSIFSAKYCFVENLLQSGRMPEPEYVVLTAWFDWLIAHENIPIDLIVYLQTRPETVWQRIQKRCRKEEKNIPLEYLKQLHNLHEDWLITRRRFTLPCPVLVIDANSGLNEMEDQFQKHTDQILCLNGVPSPPSSDSISGAVSQ